MRAEDGRKKGDRFTVVTASTVEEFLVELRVGNERWGSARDGDLAFRGQGNSVWRVVPGAFRPGQRLGFLEGGGVPHVRQVLRQAMVEFRTIREFVVAADEVGLDVGPATQLFLQSDDPRDVFQDEDWEHSWPQEEVLQILALAQHHGVPTRLVDFTDNPLVACYFAAESAWKEERDQGRGAPEESELSVWVVDLRFVRAVRRVRHRYPERLAEIRLPRGQNPYLHAQAALFLMDRGANDVMHRGVELSIDQAVIERAEFWSKGDRLSGHGVTMNWFNEIPLAQVRLKRSHAAEVLVKLEELGVSRGALMPSMDRVVEGLEMMRSIGLGKWASR